MAPTELMMNPENKDHAAESPISDKPKKKKAGRPKGATTMDRDVVDVIVSRCPKCDSTEREPYNRTPRIIEAVGYCQRTRQPFTRIILRTTKCLACGQARVDRTMENAPTGGNK